MPTVEFDGREIECDDRAILRDVLLAAGVPPHNGPTGTINCGGHSTCGTCAVEVDGPVSDRTDVERWRLSLPPHRGNDGLRLACQTRVEGDVSVRKYDGFWGQHAVDPGLDDGADEPAYPGDGEEPPSE